MLVALCARPWLQCCEPVCCPCVGPQPGRGSKSLMGVGYQVWPPSLAETAAEAEAAAKLMAMELLTVATTSLEGRYS